MMDDSARVLALIGSGRVQHNWEKHYQLKMGDIFVEGGAFWGRYIWKASKNVGSTGRVIAIEPSPKNIRILKVLIKAENLENVTLVEKALWNGPGRDLLFTQGNSASHQLKSLPGAQTGKPLPEDADYVEVELNTIDNILTDLGIDHVDLLSADIEGAELGMLKGCEKYLSEKRIRNIAVAVYHIPVPKQEEFMSILRDKGYEVSLEDEGIVYAQMREWGSAAKRGDDGIDWDAEALRASAKPTWPASGAGPDCDYFRSFVKPHDRVLDLGCNIASCIGVWRDLEPTIEYEGLDWSPVAIKIARERYPNAKFYAMDAKDMDFEGRFDIIFTHAFYQHNNRVSKRIIVPRVHRALKKGGLHIIEENISVSSETCMLMQEYIDFFEGHGFKLIKALDFGDGGGGFIFKKV